MSFLNPIQVGGGAINAVNQSLPQLPFSPNSLSNMLPSLVGGVANKTATNLLSLVIGPWTTRPNQYELFSSRISI